MLGMELTTAYLLIVAIATLLVASLVWARQRGGKPLAGWAAASLLGILLGSIGSFAVMRQSGYTIERAPVETYNMPVVGMADGGGAAGPSGPEMMGGGPGGGMMGGGMGGGMGGPRAPQPKRELTMLVRKLDLLTGDIGITLTADQQQALGEALAGIEEAEAMSDDDAKAKQELILAVLDDEQEGRLNAIGLPRPTGGMGGGGMGGPGGGMGGMGGGGQAPENPFQQETEGNALTSLRQKLGAETPAAEAPAETAAEMPAEAPAETPAEAPAAAPAETPTETPAAETPAESPADAPAEMPAEAPQETPADAPADTSSEAPAEAPAETSAEPPA